MRCAYPAYPRRNPTLLLCCTPSRNLTHAQDEANDRPGEVSPIPANPTALDSQSPTSAVSVLMEASAETSTSQRPSNYGALATLDVESAIDEIASGTLSKEIAERFGVTPRAVRNKLAKHPDYPQAVKDQAQSLVEEATGLAMTCGNADVPIARLRVETAHKWAAVADPERFSPKAQALNVNIGVQVSLTAVALGSIEDLLGAVVSTQQTVESAATSPDLPIISPSSGASD